MRAFDLSPLFRSTVGFDHLADMLDSVAQFDSAVSYPKTTIAFRSRSRASPRRTSP